jgi:hypothetical protein
LWDTPFALLDPVVLANQGSFAHFVGFQAYVQERIAMFVRKPDAAVCSALFGKVKRGPEGFAQVNANLRTKILDFV